MTGGLSRQISSGEVGAKEGEKERATASVDKDFGAGFWRHSSKAHMSHSRFVYGNEKFKRLVRKVPVFFNGLKCNVTSNSSCQLTEFSYQIASDTGCCYKDSQLQSLRTDELFGRGKLRKTELE